ncbi:hypothetical protein BJ165DRAFT_1527400 [Panaeolus papilionaceus]|nr:hypothetical protein BJ165DRAFT_1527400 [Panaeolus papilionaceus]
MSTSNSPFGSKAKPSRLPYGQQYAKPRSKSNPMMKGLQDTHSIITVPGSQDHKEEVIISDVKCIGSYNWIKGPLDEPTIIVPGSPAHWDERPLPYGVQPDVGPWPVDEHTLRLPSAPFLPLVAAVNQIQQDHQGAPFDWASVDFITSRNVLRNLTRWTRGQSKDDFRIDLDVVGKKTVLLNRWTSSNSEGEFWGNTFGINFEKESTTIGEDCENATGNIRVVTYDLNGLKMVVRFEVNACIPEDYIQKGVGDPLDDLTTRLERVEINRILPIFDNIGPLNIIRGGKFPEEAAIEITTRSAHNLARNSFDWREAYPQLFLSQTKHHFLAIHDRGHFAKLEKRTLESKEFKSVEKDVQNDLKRLHSVLQTIQGKVQDWGTATKLSLVFRKHHYGTGAHNFNLQLYRREKAVQYPPEFFGLKVSYTPVMNVKYELRLDAFPV